MIPHDVLYLVPLYRAETLMSILHSNTRCQIFASYILNQSQRSDILNHALTPHDLEPVEPSREGGMWSVESEGGMWWLESERVASLSSWLDGPTASTDDLNSCNSSNSSSHHMPPSDSCNSSNSSKSLLHHRQETAANPPRITCLPRNTDRGGSRWRETEER